MTLLLVGSCVTSWLDQVSQNASVIAPWKKNFWSIDSRLKVSIVPVRPFSAETPVTNDQLYFWEINSETCAGQISFHVSRKRIQSTKHLFLYLFVSPILLLRVLNDWKPFLRVLNDWKRFLQVLNEWKHFLRASQQFSKAFYQHLIYSYWKNLHWHESKKWVKLNSWMIINLWNWI